MRWRKVLQKIIRIDYKLGKKSNHFDIFNCPCQDKLHPVKIETKHLPDECRLFDAIKRQLGPHLQDFLRA